MTFGPKSTAEEVAAGHDLTGKVVIVTGGGGGIGVEATRAFAGRGAHVFIAARSPARAEVAAKEIRESTGNPKVEVLELDLSSQLSVRKAAHTFQLRNLPLNYLVNNAAVMAVPERRLTVDGIEEQFGTNHVGHFLFTNLLAGPLVRGAPSRIISVSSVGHRQGGVRFDDYNFDTPGAYSKWVSYGQAKTANILFAIAINRRLAPYGVEAFSLHPGGIMTGLQEHLTKEEMIGYGWINEEGKVHEGFKTVQQGASTHLYAALAPELAGNGGAYLEDCKISQTLTEEARDPANAERLWTLSEKLVKQEFPY